VPKGVEMLKPLGSKIECVKVTKSISKLLWFRKFLIFNLFKKIFFVHSFIKLAKFKIFIFSLKKLKN